MDTPRAAAKNSGTLAAGRPRVARFSSEQAAHPVEQWREVFGQAMLRMDLEPLPGHDLHAEWKARALPGSRIAWAKNSPIRISLRQRMVVDPSDSISLQWATTPRVGKHMGREIAVAPSEAVFLSATDPGSLAFTAPGSLVCMTFPRNALGPLLREKDICLGTKLPAQSGALRLLLRYLEILRDEAEPTPELQHLTLSHIYDLLALALGATRDAAETAKGRGVRAARLHAIKSEILENLHDEKLGAADFAARHHLTPRQIQLLFSSEGTTFTDFVREQRLARAHRMLQSPRFDDKPISDVAFACGFGDLSYFNRSFRSRYQATPSDVRNAAAQSGRNGTGEKLKHRLRVPRSVTSSSSKWCLARNVHALFQRRADVKELRGRETDDHQRRRENETCEPEEQLARHDGDEHKRGRNVYEPALQERGCEITLDQVNAEVGDDDPERRRKTHCEGDENGRNSADERAEIRNHLGSPGNQAQRNRIGQSDDRSSAVRKHADDRHQDELSQHPQFERDADHVECFDRFRTQRPWKQHGRAVAVHRRLGREIDSRNRNDDGVFENLQGTRQKNRNHVGKKRAGARDFRLRARSKERGQTAFALLDATAELQELR